MIPVNYSEMLNQTVNFKGRTLKFRDFVERFKLYNDNLDNPNGVVLTPETRYYMRQLNRHKDLKFFMSLNISFSAFGLLLNGFSWLIYRRMNLYACYYIIVCLIMLAVLMNSSYLFKMDEVIAHDIIIKPIIWLGLFMKIIPPFLGNYLYFKKIAHDIIRDKPIKKDNASIGYYLTFSFLITPIAIGLMVIICTVFYPALFN